MRKYPLSIIWAVVFTIPLWGYFIVNGYWWLYDGNVPNADKMAAAFLAGVMALFVQAFLVIEIES